MRLRPLAVVLVAVITATGCNPSCGSSAPQAAPPKLAPWKLLAGTPAEAGLSDSAVGSLIERAEDTRSDTLILIQDRRVIIERYFNATNELIETMSVTKSIVALAIGVLLEDGKIESLDTPLAHWFPDWSAGKKARVTLRHVLSQTSGLEHESGDVNLVQQDDRLAYARGLPITAEPGAEFSYNNEATQLLSGVVRAAAGKPVHEVLKARLFTPLGIEGWSWDKDPSGNDLTYTGLRITARGLARIGQMILDRGRHDGRQIIDAAFLDEMLSPSQKHNPRYGLLWWLRESEGGGLEANANGWLGQFLVIDAARRRVAVRQRSAATPDGATQVVENRLFGFLDFPRLISELGGDPAPPR